MNKPQLMEILQSCLLSYENMDKPLFTKEQIGRNLNDKIKYLVPSRNGTKRSWSNVSIKNQWLGKIDQENPFSDDTLHTFLKNTRNIPKTNKINKINDKNNIIPITYIINKKVCKASPKKNNPKSPNIDFKELDNE